MSSGGAESTRIRLLAACVVRAYQADLPLSEPTCCPVLPQPAQQLPTTQTESNYVLQKAIKCPVLYNTPVVTGYACLPVYTPTIPYLSEPGTEPPQGPAVPNVFRSFPRIAGIEQICKPLVGRSSSDRTARLKAGLLSAADTRYVQSVLPIVPYPPCPPRASRAGIPVAPIQPCNLGTRRVDYSNPRAN
jgi:hypothetical protein